MSHRARFLQEQRHRHRWIAAPERAIIRAGNQFELPTLSVKKSQAYFVHICVKTWFEYIMHMIPIWKVRGDLTSANAFRARLGLRLGGKVGSTAGIVVLVV